MKANTQFIQKGSFGSFVVDSYISNPDWVNRPVEYVEKAPVDKLLDEVEEFMNNCIGWNLSRVELARHEILKTIKEFRSNE